jgi:6-pyruvoyltetrahydropterin/6-carboxytetrahydropterin synthase
MSWEIDKTIEFCYGHRVHTQTLNGEYADDLKCACRHLHGHEGKVQIFLSGNELDKTGMITDFRHLEWLKKWINLYIDHHFILDINDPLYDKMIGDKSLIGIKVDGVNKTFGQIIDITKEKSIIPNNPDYEYYEGFFIVDFVPTSENLSKWLGQIVKEKMAKLNVNVSKIDWWETPKSRSTWINDEVTKND